MRRVTALHIVSEFDKPRIKHIFEAQMLVTDTR